MAKAKMKVSKKKVKSTKTSKVKANPNRVRGFGRGYNVELTTKKYNFGTGTALYEVYIVSGPKVDGRRTFVDEDSVKLFIERNEMDVAEDRALAGKSFGGMMARGVIKEMADMKAAADLPELNTELPEKCDKTSVEDIDA